MKISIIIPVLNREDSISRCLHSVMDQNYDNLEIVVVDNGSSDRTIDIVNNFKKRDQRIRLLHAKKLGVSSARNLGLSCSTGDYIMFLDSDDTIAPETIATLLKISVKNGYLIVKCNYKIENGNNIRIPSTLSGEFAIDDKFWKIFFSSHKLNQVWGQLIKREIVSDLKFDEEITMAEDYLFNYNLYKNVDKIYICDKNYYSYFYSEDGLNFNKNYKKVLKKISDILFVCRLLYVKSPRFKYEIMNRFINEIIPHISDAFTNKCFVFSDIEFLVDNNFYKESLENYFSKSISKRIVVLLLKLRQYRILKIIFFFRILCKRILR